MHEESPVRVLERACRVLDCFSAGTPRIPMAGLRRRTGLPPTTASRIVKTLVAQELLERDGDEYRLGLRVLVWAGPAMAGSQLVAAAGPVVEQVRDYTGESSGLYVRQGATRVTVLATLSAHSVMYRAQIGQVRPLHAGAAGKVFMAYDPAALGAALRRGLAPFTPQTITAESDLRAQLEVVLRRGWAFAAEENELGLNSIAVPVLGGDSRIVGVLAVGGPSFRLTRPVAEQMAPTLISAGRTLSHRLGCTTNGVPSA